MSKTKKDYALLGDAPVLEAGRPDHLEFENPATVLAGAAIETANPLTIGIFGEWGTGKTSLMRLIEQKVEERKSEAVPVWFNAWQYEKEEHLIVPLIATISKELMRALEENTSWSDTVSDWVGKVGAALRSVAYGFCVKGKVGIPLVSEADVNLSAKNMIERYQDLTKDSLLQRSLYFDAFEQLEDLASNRPDRRKTDTPPRIVVFVDDLDRCFPEKAVELIEGIKLVLHQPGFSFVLGINDLIIKAFIRTKYEQEYRIDARHFEDYLDKIVQVKVPVPQRKSDEMDAYIRALLEEGEVFSGASTQDLIPLVAEAGRRNPRSIVRLLNRIIITSKIAGLENKEDAADPLALLLHLATDEEHYQDLRDALLVPLAENSGGGTVGGFLATKLASHEADHIGWVEDLQAESEKLGSPSLAKAIKTLADNAHLCRLLATPSGQEWLQNKEFRELQQEASEATRGDEKSPATARSSKEPIRELLDGMKRIKGGEFRMGGEREKQEQPVHTVRLTDFELGATPVTQAQYEAIMGTHPPHFKGANRPVENVSWEEAVEFCEKLSAETGAAFSLPTEAQWEYACRAGSPAAWCFGDEPGKLDDYAWYEGNSGGETHPVREKRPNDWGLYDMHGNVWEWCQDWFAEGYYQSSPELDPKGPGKGSNRVDRGGSWDRPPEGCRSAYRRWDPPSVRYRDLGFRVARSSVP